MTVHCPDCLFEVPVRKPGKDGRCNWCRPQLGDRQHSVPRRNRGRYLADVDELRARFLPDNR